MRSSGFAGPDAQGADESKLPIEIVAISERHHKTVRGLGPTLLDGLQRAPMSTRAVLSSDRCTNARHSRVPYQSVSEPECAASGELKALLRVTDFSLTGKVRKARVSYLRLFRTSAKAALGARLPFQERRKREPRTAEQLANILVAAIPGGLHYSLVRILWKIGLILALQLLCPFSLPAQNYGGQLYYSIDFPGGNWSSVPIPATSVSIGNPTGITTDAAGNVYIGGPSIIFKLDSSGLLTRIAGDGHNGYAGDGGAAVQAELGIPFAYPLDPADWGEAVGNLAADAAGNLYVADMFNNRIRKIALDGSISTIAGDGGPGPFDVHGDDGNSALSARLWLPMGVAAGPHDGQLYIADAISVRQITPDGVIRSLYSGYSQGLAVDSSGNIYLAEGCRVRKITPYGTVTRVAGYYSHCGYSGDGGPATAALLTRPYGVAVDSIGNLFIADTYNNRIRKVSTDGIITTIAGSGPPFLRDYSGDGGPATEAQLSVPHAVAVDTAGNVYIADTGSIVVRKVSPDGIITTVAGNGLWWGGVVR